MLSGCGLRPEVEEPLCMSCLIGSSTSISVPILNPTDHQATLNITITGLWRFLLSPSFTLSHFCCNRGITKKSQYFLYVFMLQPKTQTMRPTANQSMTRRPSLALWIMLKVLQTNCSALSEPLFNSYFYSCFSLKPKTDSYLILRPLP